MGLGFTLRGLAPGPVFFNTVPHGPSEHKALVLQEHAV